MYLVVIIDRRDGESYSIETTTDIMSLSATWEYNMFVDKFKKFPFLLSHQTKNRSLYWALGIAWLIDLVAER